MNSAAAERIDMTLLEKEPAKRYASADALLHDLTGLPAVEESSSVGWRRVRGSPAAHTPGWPRQLVLLGTLLLAAAAGVGMPGGGGGTLVGGRHRRR